MGRESSKRLRRNIIRVAALIIAVLAIVFSLIAVFNYAFFEEKVSGGVAKYGLFGIFLFVLFLEVIPQYTVPQLGVVSGLLLGYSAISVFLASAFGAIIGSILGFFLGRRYGHELVDDLFGRKTTERIVRGINRRGKWFVTLVAVTPLPYIPMVIGSLRMEFNKFVIYGVIPRVVGYAALTIFFAYFV